MKSHLWSRTHPIEKKNRLVAFAWVSLALVLGYFVPGATRAPIAGINPLLGRDQMIAFLSAVSSGMMAFTGIVFSLLFILLQFSSSAYTPHLVPLLTRNRVLTHACGVFAGTFLYSLMALRGAGAVEGGTTELTVWVAFVWLLASVYLLLRLVGVFTSLTISDVLDMLGDYGHREIERMYGPYSPRGEALPVSPASADHVTQTLEYSGRPLYVIAIDVPRLVALARAADVVIRLPIAIGDAITSGARVASVHGSGGAIPEKLLRQAIVLAADRTTEHGPKQDMRLLVDIAIRALSAAVNDPTTAVHALDQLEALLVHLGQSNLEVGSARDSSGAIRVVYDTATWEEYLELSVTEIQQYGAGSVQVERRLAALLALLLTTVPEERRAAVQRFLRERQVILRSAFPAGALRELAEIPDRQGLGHAR